MNNVRQNLTKQPRINRSRLRAIHTGLTMIELLVALALGVLLTAGVGQIFMTNHQTQRLEHALSQVQDTGRYALDIMATDIRQSGYYGCLTPQYSNSRKSSINNLDSSLNIKVIAKNSSIDPDKMFTNGLNGYTRKTDNTFSPTLPTSLSNISSLARNGSDVIRVTFASTSDGSDKLASDHSPANPTADIQINATTGNCPKKDDLYLLASCNNGHLFRITNEPNCSTNPVALQHSTSGNTTDAIDGLAYLTDNSTLMRVMEVVYFVGNTGRTGADSQPVFALYRRVNGATPEEMLEGVEFLKVEFGQLLDNGNIRYITPDDTSLKSSEIVAARIGVLAKNAENVMASTDTLSYALPGGVVTSSSHGGGKVLRKPFVSTIKLRNRS